MTRFYGICFLCMSWRDECGIAWHCLNESTSAEANTWSLWSVLRSFFILLPERVLVRLGSYQIDDDSRLAVPKNAREVSLHTHPNNLQRRSQRWILRSRFPQPTSVKAANQIPNRTRSKSLTAARQKCQGSVEKPLEKRQEIMGGALGQNSPKPSECKSTTCQQTSSKALRTTITWQRKSEYRSRMKGNDLNVRAMGIVGWLCGTPWGICARFWT